MTVKELRKFLKTHDKDKEVHLMCCNDLSTTFRPIIEDDIIEMTNNRIAIVVNVSDFDVTGDE